MLLLGTAKRQSYGILSYQLKIRLICLGALGGDFNSVLSSAERTGVSNNTAALRVFNAFLDEANVIDLPLFGMSYMWSNQREEAVWARLDRFLISTEILSWFPNLQQVGLSRSLSDHNAIALCEHEAEEGPRPFRCLNEWLEDGDLIKLVVNGWKCRTEIGAGGYVLFAKIKDAKIALKRGLGTKKKENVTTKELEN
ncbi:hypothetical protein Dsin_022081 [Dipteronia sinensis]|uniref:Endonuclease/exonuclease/phosphatase domain-containing protein n=1 Tax=Dipteronia sinensis TaxID=43782 RepID=A0AAE0A2B4_9ROSI|nr:hypothetical protein Dsin_022081 [Dipteronia sinensis]